MDIKCVYPGCESRAKYSMIINDETRYYCDPHFCLAERVAVLARDVKAILSRTKLDDGAMRLENGNS